MMIIYEITATVKPGLIRTHEKYMREQHIPELLEPGYLIGASMERSSLKQYRIR